MKILILCSKGMLAQDLARIFKEKNLILWDRKDLDITNERMVIEKIGLLKHNIIINAAAFTDVDESEENKDLDDDSRNKKWTYRKP